MANTYTQLYYHIIFAVKGRFNLISLDWEEELYKYIAGIISNNKQKLMIINGMPDHLHILLSASPNINLSHLIGEIKANSSKWINSNNLSRRKFSWQSGYSAFTVGRYHKKITINYIKNQNNHHKSISFLEEYKNLLNEHEIQFDPKYIFK